MTQEIEYLGPKRIGLRRCDVCFRSYTTYWSHRETRYHKIAARIGRIAARRYLEWQRAVELVRDFDTRRDNWAEWSRVRRELEEYVEIDRDTNYSFQVVEPKPQRSVA
ncbi:MAG TPA: hypothetical protein VM784_01035 [Actinomycetota bacterium]|nr:hypothetical protein [Actinomycetota bacterium]